jgi:hypothetical protein
MGHEQPTATAGRYNNLLKLSDFTAGLPQACIGAADAAAAVHGPAAQRH